VPTTQPTPRNRVWIEFEKPTDDAHAACIVEQANRMLERLKRPGDECGTFGWGVKRKQFDYGTDTGRENLVDRGPWFSLGYFGRS
jgi:hypothetical protein